jgi:hypothetical protein
MKIYGTHCYPRSHPFRSFFAFEFIQLIRLHLPTQPIGTKNPKTERVFDLPLSFASQYISDQILMETQFDHERLNTERIRSYVLNESPKHLKGGVAYVPDVYAGLSTERLLVLEFIEGVSTTFSFSVPMLGQWKVRIEPRNFTMEDNPLRFGIGIRIVLLA